MAVCDHDPCSANPITGHVRLGATPGELMEPDELASSFARAGMHEPYPSRVIVADCSCGGIYIVPQGEDEYDALETAHRAHVKLMREGC
jgi:hypothetical protein